MENSLLYDWLTFSSKDLDFQHVLEFMGLPLTLDFQNMLGSRLRYQYRNHFHGINIHWSSDLLGLSYNDGICVEMSGQGCRAYETYSGRSMADLVALVRAAGYHVSRVDIAYDDFSGVIPLDRMAEQARNFWFTSRLQQRKIVNESKISDSEIAGLTVSHGSKSSRIYCRCYDKRVERSAFNICDHWVRFEIQLRDENACQFLDNPAPLGDKFSGVLREYLNYREPSDTQTTNKRMWEVSPWWTKFLGDAAAISIASKKDEVYNRDRFSEFVWNMRNVIRTAILLDGPGVFFQKIMGNMEDLPSKYDRLLHEYGICDPAELQRFLDFLEGGEGND